jgi:zinc protease
MFNNATHLSAPAHTVERRMLGPTPLLVLRDSSYPMVRFTLALRRGALLDDAEPGGTFSLMLELLLRGTQRQTRQQFHADLERLGSSLEAGVGNEQAYIAGAALRRHLEQTVALACEAILTPAFADDELEQLRDETQAALVQARDDDEEVAAHFVRQALWGDHPLGRDPDGTCTTLGSIGLPQVRAAYQKLAASDLIVGVVGDITADAAEALFAPLVAGLNRPAAAPTVLPPVPQPDRLRVLLVDKPGRTQVQLRLARLALDAHHPEVDAFWLGVMAFGGTFTSPFTREVRDVRGWSYVAQADFRRRAAYPSPVVLRAAPSCADAVPCLTLMFELYAQLAGGRLQAQDVVRARDYVQNRYVFDIATAYDVIGPALTLERLGLPVAHLWDFPERLGALNAEAVPPVVGRHLQAGQAVATLVGPAGALLEPLQAALPDAAIDVVDFRDGLDLNS